MVAVAAAMETPAIMSALGLARPHRAPSALSNGHSVWREILLNGSVVILLGAFAVGMITGARGLATLKPFLIDLFPGLLCLFLLDMGLVAGRGLKNGRQHMSPALVLFAVVMPLIGASIAAVLSLVIGLSVGGTAVFMTLAASASYIAVPAALRPALPEANPVQWFGPTCMILAPCSAPSRPSSVSGPGGPALTVPARDACRGSQIAALQLRNSSDVLGQLQRLQAAVRSVGEPGDQSPATRFAFGRTCLDRSVV